ncbi:MAG: hypothetical protein IIB81_03970 [Nanoarchaeota archaeon]|nr:hypothetical protein [Nanoarchaeota archaeon]
MRKINITTNETMIYNSGESIKFKNLLNNGTYPFIIEYWIEDFFGNIYKTKFNTTNTNQKSWKTRISEQDRVLFIKSVVYPTCNDSNLLNNYAEKMFIVKSEDNDLAGSNDESTLEILEVDDKVKFGDTAGIKVSIYKGNTNKYSISLWVEDNGKKISETTKIHLYDKYSSYNGQLPVKIDSNCNKKLKDGGYDVVLKGLDKEDKEEIEIEGIKTSSCPKSSSTSSSSTSSKKSSSKKFSYDLKDFDKNIELGKEFKTQIIFDNNDNKDMDIKVWSYVYRGSKSYSGDREENKKEFILKGNSLHIIDLSNIVEEAEPGNYKFKVVVNKNNQKTNNEIKKDIVINEKSNKNEQIQTNLNNKNINAENLITANSVLMNNGLVYESTTEKAKNLIPIFLIILSIMINIVLIWKR